MAKTVLSKEEVVSKYGKNANKKIGGWIALIVIGSLLFIGGFAMFIVGLVEEIVALIAIGPICYSILSIPLMILGITFTVLNSVKRGIARNKLKKADCDVVDKH